MMNRQEFVYREVDCSRTLLLTQGGESQRIVFFGADVRDAVHPYLREWLDRGRPVTDNLPRGAVLELESEQLLADRAGAFTTTAPVSYAPEVVEQLEAIPPPIRFGGNLTLLGYEPNVERNFLPGDFVDVITYWRVEGELAPDLTIFNHILSDPDFPFGVRDVIGVKPSLMHGRDVFIQVTPVQLRETALPGEYYVSVGAYLPSQNNERLPVLLGEQAHGNRIYLYPINVLPLPADTESGG